MMKSQLIGLLRKKKTLWDCRSRGKKMSILNFFMGEEATSNDKPSGVFYTIGCAFTPFSV